MLSYTASGSVSIWTAQTWEWYESSHLTLVVLSITHRAGLWLTTAMTKLNQSMTLVNREVSIGTYSIWANITAANRLVTVSWSAFVLMLILCYVAPAHGKRERKREKGRERESTLATCTYRTEKVASWVTDYLALKIVVHSVGGSRHLLGVQLKTSGISFPQ